MGRLIKWQKYLLPTGNHIHNRMGLFLFHRFNRSKVPLRQTKNCGGGGRAVSLSTSIATAPSASLDTCRTHLRKSSYTVPSSDGTKTTKLDPDISCNCTCGVESTASSILNDGTMDASQVGGKDLRSSAISFARWGVGGYG